MSFYTSINKDLPETEKYELLVRQIEILASGNEPVISILSNISAALKDTIEKASWAGFYLRNGNILHLGPFQGKAACTEIQIGKGVCSTAALKNETLIVNDVDKFEGHIACDSDSKSEIVSPIALGDYVWGVIDLDSISYNAFGEKEKYYMEKIAAILAEKINLEKIKNILI